MIAALLFAAAPPSFVVGDLKVIGDWAVRCDNERSFQAASLPIEEGPEEPLGDGDLTFPIKRSGNPYGPASDSIGGEEVLLFREIRAASSTMPTIRRILIDNRTLYIRLNPDPNGDQLDAASSAKLIAAMRGKKYVQSAFALFEDDDPVIRVDWGEEDDNIIRTIAAVLELDDLMACFDNDSCDLLITYHGTEHSIRYPKEGVAQRDTTIIALNALLQPDHELCLCNASRGTNTLALMALSAADWSLLEREHSAGCAEHFQAIGDAPVIFGR